MSEGLVSIIIPAYKTEPYLEESIRSALEQNYPSTEIILVDDGSPDRCPQIMDEYGEKYEKISVIHQENQGIGVARNTGLKAAKGEYVFFMDSDDMLDGPGSIQKLMEKALEENADIVMGNFRKLQGTQILEINHHHLKGGSYTETPNFRFEGFYRYGHLAYNWGKLYRRSFLTENQLFCRPYPFTQDKAQNMLCYAYHPRYAFIEDSVYLYRINASSVTFRYKENLIPVWISIATDFHQMLKDRGVEDSFGDITAFHIFFGSFFIIKQELAIGRGIRETADTIRKYAEDSFVNRVMGELAKGKYVKEIHTFSWRVMIRSAAILFHMRGYYLFTLGIAMLRGMHIDGIISDKRNKKKTQAEKKREKTAAGRITPTPEVLCLCRFLSMALTGKQPQEEQKKSLAEAGSDTVVQLAYSHRVLPMLYDVLAECEEELRPEMADFSALVAERTVRQSYRLLFLTREIVGALKEAGIPVVVLKGCGVASYYPVPEYRKSGDVDLLLGDLEKVKQAGAILEAHHYHLTEEQHANHHLVYQGPDGIDIELHAMLAEPFDDTVINQKMEALSGSYLKERQSILSMGVELPITSDALQALELLLHMLQHFLRAGFGLKLLADWVVFWNRTDDPKTVERFRSLVEECGVTGFAKAVTLVCENYLGLVQARVYGPDLEKDFSAGYVEEFLMEIVDAEEFGNADKNRMVALRKRGLFAYAKEFHYQMRMNNPEESRKKWKWPYLWMKTLIVFLNNNKRLKRGSVRNILRSAGERAGVVEQMHLFTKS